MHTNPLILLSLSVEEWKARSKVRQRRLQAADCGQRLLQCSATVVRMIEFIESMFRLVHIELLYIHSITQYSTIHH